MTEEELEEKVLEVMTCLRVTRTFKFNAPPGPLHPQYVISGQYLGCVLDGEVFAVLKRFHIDGSISFTTGYARDSESLKECLKNLLRARVADS